MICDRCIHHEICCNEGRDDEAKIYCADLFELVMCKDCKKHYNLKYPECLWTDDDFYCADGERKESKVKKCFDVPKEVAEMLLEDTEGKETNEQMMSQR